MVTRKLVAVRLALALGSLPLQGCAGKTAPETVHQQVQDVGKLGYKALSGVEVIEHTVAALYDAKAPGVTQDRTASVMKLAYRAGGDGQKLATLLEKYQTTADAVARAAMDGDINAAIQAFSTSVAAISGVDLGSATGQLVSLVSNVTSIIDQIKLGIAAMKSSAREYLTPLGFLRVDGVQTPQLRASSLLVD